MNNVVNMNESADGHESVAFYTRSLARLHILYYAMSGLVVYIYKLEPHHAPFTATLFVFLLTRFEDYKFI